MCDMYNTKNNKAIYRYNTMDSNFLQMKPFLVH